MISFDAGALLRAMLADPAGRVMLRELLVEAAEEGARRALDNRAEVLLDGKAAALFLGLTPAAWKMRRRRHPELDALAVGAGRFRRWRRADLEAWLRTADRGPRRDAAEGLHVIEARRR